MYKKALQIAYKAHEGQLRHESKVPYIVHPIRVANNFKDDTKKTIAVLHDVVEDSDITLKDLILLFSIEVYEVVNSLTRREGEDYFDYIKRLKQDPLAVEIKIADVVDNLSDSIAEQKPSMIKRYVKTLGMLIK